MSNVRALIIGVSKYYIEGATDLPFCVNDAISMEEALYSGLKLGRNDIVSYFGEVNVSDFEYCLLKMNILANKDDIVIFYFSGHGTTISNKHYLVFSDKLVDTQEIIKYFEKIQSKSKIIFLDCCFSGNFSVDQTLKFDIKKTISEFEGKGYAVFSSSNSSQVSYRHPDKPISIFTNFLCNAFQDKYIIKKGKISLYDLQKLVSLYLEIWNKKNPDKQQHPIFRSNIGGTIFLKVEEYKPFYVEQIYKEYDKYIIYKVEPLHNGMTKRYSVKVILKETFSFEEIGKISLDIKDKIKLVDVYNNEISEKQWKGKLANIIWIYFGRDESDIINGNFICCTTWVDEKQDKEWWYKVDNKNTFMMNGIHYEIYQYYEQLKSFNEKNTANKYELIPKVKEILKHMINLGERIIELYCEYKNESFTESELCEKLESLIDELDKYYIISTNLDLPPNEIYEWFHACTNLFGTIHDFTLFYNKKYISERTTKNRKDCMDMTIKRYYYNLDKISKFEKGYK